MDEQDKYISQLFWRSQASTKETIFSEQNQAETLISKLLEWIIATLESSDAFLLSWPDRKGLMHVQESAIVTTPGLKEVKTITCFDELSIWLDSNDDHWVRGDTSNVPELQSVHIKSILITKVLTKIVIENEEVFQGKELLVVCNRAEPALDELMYVSYDNGICDIVRWVLQLHISELYKLKSEKYQDTRNRYRSTKGVNSLSLVGETARDLLNLYRQYSAIPPSALIYECLNAYIALFNAKKVETKDLKTLLKNCETWLIAEKKGRNEDLELIHFTLARGYCSLGVSRNKEWKKGKNLLKWIGGRSEQDPDPNSYQIEVEEARTYWWLIYCKCQQISQSLVSHSAKNKSVSRAEMKGLAGPCKVVQEVTKEVLWFYLKSQYDTDQISLTQPDLVSGVKITSVWLWAYFGYCLLESEMCNRYHLEQQAVDQRFTAYEQLEFYQRSSTFFLHLLREFHHYIPNGNLDSLMLEELEGINYSQFSQALIFLLSEYCHLELTIPRELDVEAHLQRAAQLDFFGYPTKERNRDHTLHVVDVCLLGFFLLQSHLSEGQTLHTLISNRLPVNSKNYTIQNWFLAALFHDIGYSLEIEEQIWGELQIEKQTEQSQINNETHGIGEAERLKTLLSIHKSKVAYLELQQARYGLDVPFPIISQLEHEEDQIRQIELQLNYLHPPEISPTVPTQSYPREFLLDRKKSDNHGKRSHKYVKQIIDALPNNDKDWSEIFTPALKAIRKHDLKEKVIIFSKEPLSYLLILCDELQEWGRPKLDYLEYREAIVSNVFFPNTSIFPTNKLLKHLFFEVKLDDEKSCGLIPGAVLNFCLSYRDATKAYFEPLIIWLLKSYNLQRLQVDEEELRITMAMRNPVCEEIREIDSPDACEFSLIRDFMRDQRKWQALRYWVENTNAVRWECKRNEDSEDPKIILENVVLDLNACKSRELFHDDPNKILDDLFQWRKDYIDGKRRRI